MAKKRTINTKKQLEALRGNMPDDAPADGSRAARIESYMYPESLGLLDDLAESAGVNRSRLLRMAVAYAAANKEDFLNWGKSGVHQKTTPPN